MVIGNTRFWNRQEDCRVEFHIHLAGARPDLGAVEVAVLDADPAALIDLDASGNTLRVAGALTAVDLVVLMRHAGCPVMPQQVEQLPSICCGGCSG